MRYFPTPCRCEGQQLDALRGRVPLPGVAGARAFTVALTLWFGVVSAAMFIPALIPAPAVAAVTVPPLATPPEGERWFSITMNGERTGFAATKVTAGPRGYDIHAEGSAKMVVLGFSREAASREQYQVNKDLSLRSLFIEQTIDGSPMKLSGEMTPKGLKIVVESKGNRKERLIRAKGAVFPATALNLYPLMQGVSAGRVYRVQIFDPEAVKIKTVKITALGLETLPEGGKVVHLQNDLYSFVSNDIWVDLAGNTVRESVRDGMVETRAEQEQVARAAFVEAALAKKDLVLDFSRIPVADPIEKVTELSELRVELSGFPEAVPLIGGAGQQVVRLPGERVLITVSRATGAIVPETPPPGDLYRMPSEWVPADNREIVALKGEILEGETHFLKIAEKLNRWVAGNIREAVTDSKSPLDTLVTRAGNCQSHARLYVSLARAAGVPSKFVSGLVYIQDKGFLYHSWAESYVGHWLAVDPTFGELPANATHIKLAEGEAPQDMMPLIGLIGRIKATVLEKGYRPITE